jgi:hypothetical protein
MTRKQADAAFESLGRHASAITAPSTPADALKLLDRAVLSRLQSDAIVHYISVGPDNLALAYSILKAGTATFVSAGFVAAGAGGQQEPAEPAAQRDAFAARLIALSEALEGTDSHERATRLLEAFSRHVSVGREHLSRSTGDDDDGEQTASPDQRAGDLLEAAGIAYALAQLLESPPRPVGAAPTRP